MAWKTLPSKNLESVASRPSLSFAYLTYALDKTTNSFSERRFLLQNRVIQFHEARHVYYGEINYYVPDVSRYSFRARTGLFPFHYHRASKVTHPRHRKVASRRRSPFVHNYIYVCNMVIIQERLMRMREIYIAGFATVNVIDLLL